VKDQAVIFDLFGTLVDNFSMREHDAVKRQMAAALSAPPEGFARLWGETFNKRATGAFRSTKDNTEYICQRLGVRPKDEYLKLAVKIRVDFTRRSLKPRDDALETLTQLRQEGYKIGLISDCSSEVPLLWADTPFAPLIHAVVFSCTVGLMKPAARIYRLACEQLGVKPQDCLYVGDGSSHELTGASRVGMHAVLIRVPYEDTYDPHRIDAEEWNGATISALREVLGLLGGINHSGST